MKLTGLVDTLITDPVVAEAVRDAKADGVTTLDLSAPGPDPPGPARRARVASRTAPTARCSR